MSNTARLNLPLISSGQFQKEVVLNEVITALDALVQTSVISTTNTPAGSPSNGDTYLVGTSPTGAWAGKANYIAYWDGTSWDLHPPKNGFIIYDQGASAHKQYQIDHWVIIFSATSWGTIIGTLSDQTDLDTALDNKLNASAYSASDVLSKIKTVDGASSGLDADLLDGQEGSYYTNAANILPTQTGNSGKFLTTNGTSASWDDVSAPSVALDDLTDVIITTPSSSQILSYDGAHWINSTPGATVSSLDDLSDVIISTPATNQVVAYDGAHWVNTTATADLLGVSALPNGTTATTQTAGSNDTKVATDAYVDTALSGKADSGHTHTPPSLLRAVQLTDTTPVAINANTTDLGYLLTLSQTSVIANPTGSPVNGQLLRLRIKSTGSQTISFDTAYRGSDDLALPTATTGSGKTDYLLFMYNSADLTWDYAAKNFGY